jgi:hypothetical protein
MATQIANVIIEEAIEATRRNLTKLEFLAMEIQDSNIEAGLTNRIMGISRATKSVVSDYRPLFKG